MKKRTSHRFLIAILLAMAPLSNALAQVPVADYEKRVDKFFQLFKSGKTDAAVDEIFRDNKYAQSKPDMVTELKMNLAKVPQFFGEYLDHVKIAEDRLHRHAVVDYFVATERGPIRFHFEFYRGTGGWVGYGINFKEDIDEWMEERAKSKFIYER